MIGLLNLKFFTSFLDFGPHPALSAPPDIVFSCPSDLCFADEYSVTGSNQKAFRSNSIRVASAVFLSGASISSGTLYKKNPVTHIHDLLNHFERYVHNVFLFWTELYLSLLSHRKTL